MIVKVESVLECSAAEAWSLVLKSSTLTFIAKPLANITGAATPFPDVWQQYETYYCKSYLFHFIPVGKRKIYFESIDSETKRMQTRETDLLVKQWDHLIEITPVSGNRCVYRDEVEIAGRILTFPVWLWATIFYRHRQRRWRLLIEKV